jgi:hypothetical protein
MTKKFSTIESWASSIGYIVERTESGLVWYRENALNFRTCSSVSDVVESILTEIRESCGVNE